VTTDTCSGCGATLYLLTDTPTRPLLCSECRNPRICRVCGGSGQGSVVYMSARPAASGEPHETHSYRDPCAACQGTGRAS
jgi:hypothetical protein